jgi:hypothetical protein
MSKLLVSFIFLLSVGCGIKGKPLPPISTTSQEAESANQKEKKK